MCAYIKLCLKKQEQLVKGLADAQNASGGNPIEGEQYIPIFENVFGPSRGHYIGLGPKPAGGGGSSSRAKGKGKAIQSDHPPNYSATPVILFSHL